MRATISGCESAFVHADTEITDDCLDVNKMTPPLVDFCEVSFLEVYGKSIGYHSHQRHRMKFRRYQVVVQGSCVNLCRCIIEAIVLPDRTLYFGENTAESHKSTWHRNLQF